MGPLVPIPEPPDFGRVVTVLLIGETFEGKPMITKIQAPPGTDMAFDPRAVMPRSGTELTCEQEHFPTMRNLLQNLSLSLHKAALLVIEKPAAPTVQPQEGG